MISPSYMPNYFRRTHAEHPGLIRPLTSRFKVSTAAGVSRRPAEAWCGLRTFSFGAPPCARMSPFIAYRVIPMIRPSSLWTIFRHVFLLLVRLVNRSKCIALPLIIYVVFNERQVDSLFLGQVKFHDRIAP